MNLVLSIIIFSQFLTPYQTKIFLDADGSFLIYARYYQGEFVAIDSIKSVSEHLTDGLMVHNLDLLRQELKTNLVQQGGYASQGLFGTFEVPLPKGGFRDFMGETGKLDVGGYVKITLGGSETFVSNLPGEERPSLLPELEMKQEMAINLDGQVGDRMRVFLDHNSERINETQNKITVTYQGREDEIIQEVEGGDTQLSIPATTYTGDIPSHRGLFGIKATAKLGPLDLVTIASREQTQTQEIEIEGSTQAHYDTIWARHYQRRRFFRLGTLDSIIDLDVFIDDNESINNNIGINYYGTAYVDTNDDNMPDDVEDFARGYFTKKEEIIDYRFLPESNTIELNSGLPVYYALGVHYTKLVNGSPVEVGQFFGTDTVDSVQLKLICPRDEFDTLSYTWHYELRNYYQVVTPGSRLDSLRIYHIASGGENSDKQDGVPYIQLLKLDVSPQDGMIDYNRVYLEDRGLLIFPDSAPFASDTLEDTDPMIYSNPYEVGYGKYYIFVKTMEAKPVYTLPENIEQVWVYLDDALQDSITDYHVDYDQGLLEFKKPVLPGQKVRIKVEYAPFFSAAEKSLVGIRGSLRPFGEASLGSSFFYRTESYPAERIRLREEPFNRMIWEVDFAYPQEMPFLTRLVDGLPFVATEAASRLNLNFEGAYSFSDLNARGEVYLDDLESATIVSNDFSIAKTSWVLGSQPVGTDIDDFALQRIIWYNPRDEDRLQASDIYEDPEDENEIADVLKVVFNPDTRNEASFGALTQYIYGENFDEVENLELIIKGKGGRVHVDFAQEISEDQLRRNKDGTLVGIGTREDEDKNRDFVWTQQDEDTGLDTIMGDDDDNIANDDGNDDYDKDGFTGKIDGTEMNRLWDTEDLDRNGVLNAQNKYYSYSVDLDDSTQYDTTGLKQDWKLFRISIKDSANWDTVIGQPDWRNIRYVRLWFDGFTETETLYVFKISATGSRWKNYGIVGDRTPPKYPKEVFNLTPVNTKTHPYYKPPYPTEKDQFGRIKTEGALEFRIENIRQGRTCVAHRRTDDNEDYRAYDTLTFYLLSAMYDKKDNHELLVSIRIGSDSLNYYEYTTDYARGDSGYNSYRLFSVSMHNLLELKRERPALGDTVSDSLYTVVGNPTLSKNQFFEVRITNPSVTALSDTIWFNDIRLLAPKKETGRIFRSNGSVNLADLASLSFTFNETNGRFRKLSQENVISEESAARRYAISSRIGLHKFLPADWGFSIPLDFNYGREFSEPRFSYFSDDIEITDEERKEQQTQHLSKSYAISVSKSNSQNWLLKHTIDRLSLNHSRSQSYLRSTLDADTNKHTGYGATYTLTPRFDVNILNQTFSLLPQSITLDASYNDDEVRSYHRTDIDSSFELSTFGVQRKKTLGPSFSATYAPHSILSASYNFSQTRDSVGTRGTYGEEVGRDQTLNTSLSPDLKIIKPRLGYNSSYHEDYGFEIRTDEDLRNVSNSGIYSFETSVDVYRIVSLFTRLRDETRDSLHATGSPSWIAQHIEDFMSHIQNPTFNYRRQQSSNYLNVKVRPDAAYQWGLADSIPSDDVSEGSYPGRSMNDYYEMRSGMNFKMASVSGAYDKTINRAFSYGGGELRTVAIKYPNLSLDILRLESLPLLKKWVRNSSLRTGLNQSIERRYDVSGGVDSLISDSKGISFNPLLSWTSTWKNGLSTTFDATYSVTDANTYSGVTVVRSKMLNWGGSANFGYTFSAPRGLSLPFLKGLRFRSNLTVNLALRYTRNTNYFTNLDRPASDASTLSANMGLSYNFSSSITGGANFDYSQSSDKNSNQDTRRVGLNIWTNVMF